MSIEEKTQIVTSLRVDPELWKEARKAAIDCDITLGELIDQAIRNWLVEQAKTRKQAQKIADKYTKPKE